MITFAAEIPSLLADEPIVGRDVFLIVPDADRTRLAALLGVAADRPRSRPSYRRRR